jgi:hypothetical protein
MQNWLRNRCTRTMKSHVVSAKALVICLAVATAILTPNQEAKAQTFGNLPTQSFGNLPVNRNYWIPVSFAVEFNTTRLKFGLPENRAAAIGRSSIYTTDIIAHPTQSGCETNIINQICTTGNCEIENSSSPKGVQRIYRQNFSDRVVFSYCAAYEFFFDDDTPILFANRTGD